MSRITDWLIYWNDFATDFDNKAIDRPLRVGSESYFMYIYQPNISFSFVDVVENVYATFSNLILME